MKTDIYESISISYRTTWMEVLWLNENNAGLGTITILDLEGGERCSDKREWREVGERCDEGEGGREGCVVMGGGRRGRGVAVGGGGGG